MWDVFIRNSRMEIYVRRRNAGFKTVEIDLQHIQNDRFWCDAILLAIFPLVITSAHMWIFPLALWMDIEQKRRIYLCNSHIHKLGGKPSSIHGVSVWRMGWEHPHRSKESNVFRWNPSQTINLYIHEQFHFSGGLFQFYSPSKIEIAFLHIEYIGRSYLCRWTTTTPQR